MITIPTSTDDWSWVTITSSMYLIPTITQKSYFKCILTYMFYTSRLFGFFLEVNNNNGSFLCKKLDNCLWPVLIIIISNEIFLTKWADLSFDVLDVFKSEEPWAQWKCKVTIKLKDIRVVPISFTILMTLNILIWWIAARMGIYYNGLPCTCVIICKDWLNFKPSIKDSEKRPNCHILNP